jgi:hypothetical protein
LVVAAVALVLLGRQVLLRHRVSTRALLAGLTGLCVGAAVVGIPYVGVIHRLTNKPTGLEILHALKAVPSARWAPDYISTAQGSDSVGTRPLILAATVGVYWAELRESYPFKRLFWSLAAVVVEVLKTTHYAGWIPASVAVFWFWPRWRWMPGAWVVLALCALHGLMLWRVAFVAGYVAERHSLVFIMCGVFWAVAGVMAMASSILRWGRLMKGSDRPAIVVRAVPALVMMLLGALALPKTLEPLHTNRAGFHAAGLWLAQHTAPDDVVVDPFCWAEYYSGRTLSRASCPGATEDQQVRYVVLGGTESEHSRLPLIPLAESLANHGSVVYRWPDQPIRFKAEKVVVYRVPPVK